MISSGNGFSIKISSFSVFFLTGCGDSKHEKIVRSELDQIQKLDENTIKAFVSYEDMMHSQSSGSDIGEETTEAVQLFFENFSYRILSSSATERTATVNVEITNLDAKALAKDLCKELIRRSISPDSTDDSLLSMNSYFTLLRDILNSHEYKQVSTTAHFELVNTDGSWTIQSTEKLEDEIVGGFISCLHDPYLITPEETAALAFDMFKEQSPKEWVSYLGMNDIFSTYSSLYQDVDLALANQIAKCFDYKIKKVTQEEDNATATVEITSLDMESVLDVYLDKLMEYASTTEAVRATDTELADKTSELLIDTLNNNTKTTSNTIKIHFTNNGKNWEMQLGDDFTDVILGNMNAAVETFQSKTTGS